MKSYQCTCCGRGYTKSDLPNTMICECDPLIGLIMEVSSVELPTEEGQLAGMEDMREAGLCVFLMDASGSMFTEPMFPDHKFPSMFGEAFVNRAEWVCRMAASGIYDLIKKGITEAEAAYICAIKFDTTQAVMFIKTVAQIRDEYATDIDFARYLYNGLQDMRGGTNINDAIRMGHGFVSNFTNRMVQGMGNYSPKYHVEYTLKGKPISVPNVRILLYTDGEQQPQYGDMHNPFQNDEADLLIGVFIGQESERGCQDLRRIVGKCPIHGNEQFLIFDTPTKNMTLKGMFRMASGASGFCPKCVSEMQKGER